MANPFDLGHVRYQDIISPSRCYRNVADVEESGYDTEQIELFRKGKANNSQRILKIFNQSSPEKMGREIYFELSPLFCRQHRRPLFCS